MVPHGWIIFNILHLRISFQNISYFIFRKWSPVNDVEELCWMFFNVSHYVSVNCHQLTELIKAQRTASLWPTSRSFSSSFLMETDTRSDNKRPVTGSSDRPPLFIPLWPSTSSMFPSQIWSDPITIWWLLFLTAFCPLCVCLCVSMCLCAYVCVCEEQLLVRDAGSSATWHTNSFHGQVACRKQDLSHINHKRLQLGQDSCKGTEISRCILYPDTLRREKRGPLPAQRENLDPPCCWRRLVFCLQGEKTWTHPGQRKDLA